MGMKPVWDKTCRVTNTEKTPFRHKPLSGQEGFYLPRGVLRLEYEEAMDPA
jgi:hypothetical protein